MKFVKVNEIPSARKAYPRNYIQRLLQDFIDSEIECAVLEYEEDHYASIDTAYSSVWGAIKNSGLNIKLHKRGDKIYLERQFKPSTTAKKLKK